MSVDVKSSGHLPRFTERGNMRVTRDQRGADIRDRSPMENISIVQRKTVWPSAWPGNPFFMKNLGLLGSHRLHDARDQGEPRERGCSTHASRPRRRSPEGEQRRCEAE